MTKASGALPEYDPLYAPCLKRRARVGGPDARYFVVPAKDVTAGYPIKTYAIPAKASEEDAAAMCQRYMRELVAWRTDHDVKPVSHTVGWLANRYLTDDYSPFRKTREKTRRSYEQNCKIIQATKGRVPLAIITGPDLLRWHHEWGQPVPVLDDKDAETRDPWGNVVTTPTTPSRARHLVVMLRILAKHAILIDAPGAKHLRDLLSEIEFPVPRARDVAATREQVEIFVKQAVEDGYLSQAITTLAQFELIERRVHIIGYWEGEGAQRQWRPGWVWQNIDWRGPNATWRIRYFQTKVGLVLRDFDLQQTPELLAMLQQIPEEHRIGPVITMERQRRPGPRIPWEERYYAEVWRQIANRAGLPANICSMDMRASGATEADATPGVSDRALQDAGGWQDPKTPQRYRRHKQRNAAEVVQMRQKAREE